MQNNPQTQGQELPDEQELQAIETQLLEGMALSAHGGSKLMRTIRHLQQERAQCDKRIAELEEQVALSDEAAVACMRIVFDRLSITEAGIARTESAAAPIPEEATEE